MSECSLQFVSQQGVWRNFFEDPCTTINDFETIIANKLNEFGLSASKTNINKMGAIIVRECIVDKLNLLCKSGGDKSALLAKIEYYNSDDFIENFSDSMPIKTSTTRTKYAGYFDTLFNVVANSDDDEGWRIRLNKYDDQAQCMRALKVKEAGFKTVTAYQNRGQLTTCYLCNRGILANDKGQKTMECEHILPVSCALSHWWLIKSTDEQKLTQSQLEELSKEYGWSHRCCNQIKTNSEFIIYDSTLDRYRFNRDLAKIMLEEIKISTNYDCPVANRVGPMDIDAQLINIQRTVQPLLDKINTNLSNVSSNDMYELICKIKIISSMNEKTFTDVISDNSVDFRAIQLRAQQTLQSNATRAENLAKKAADDISNKNRDAETKSNQINDRATRNANRSIAKSSTDNSSTDIANSTATRSAKRSTAKKEKGTATKGTATKGTAKSSAAIADSTATRRNTTKQGQKKKRSLTLASKRNPKSSTSPTMKLSIVAEDPLSSSMTISSPTAQPDSSMKLSPVSKNTPGSIMNTTPASPAAAGGSVQVGGELDERVVELLQIVGTNIDQRFEEDINEKFDDLFKYYKYTVFKENSEGAVVKHTRWIYSEDNTEETMAEARERTRAYADDRGFSGMELGGIKKKKGTIRKNRQKKKRQKRKKSTNKKRRGKTKYTKKRKNL